MKHKIRLEDVKEFKIEHGVFDERTLMALYKLLTKKVIKSVESMVMEGKESVVLSAKDSGGKWVALKVYRVESDFKTMWQYLAGDPRFFGLKKQRLSVVFAWCRREFKNLSIASEAGVNCPKPITFNENILVEEFVGEEGRLAPKLIGVKLEKEDAQEVYDIIVSDMEKILSAGLVHADLSEYNILILGKPYIIDFSQAVPVSHGQAEEFLIRDIKNINKYFKKIGAEVKDPEEFFNKLKVYLK
jgi:RIO kinase 1